MYRGWSRVVLVEVVAQIAVVVMQFVVASTVGPGVLGSTVVVIVVASSVVLHCSSHCCGTI
jgi:hypothetical protein